MLALGQRGFNRRGLLEDLAAALGCSVAHRNGETIRLSSQLQRISPRRPGQAHAETPLCALGTLDLHPSPDMMQLAEVLALRRSITAAAAGQVT